MEKLCCAFLGRSMWQHEVWAPSIGIYASDPKSVHILITNPNIPCTYYPRHCHTLTETLVKLEVG